MDAESSDDARQGKERAGHKYTSAVMEEICEEYLVHSFISFTSSKHF